MVAQVSKEAINENIRIAGTMIGARHLSLMFKQYYEGIFPALEENPYKVFSVGIQGSINYALGRESMCNSATIVTNLGNAILAKEVHGILSFYIPVNFHDDREGLSIGKARELSYNIKRHIHGSEVHWMVTSGCVNEDRPTVDELQRLSEYRQCFESVSLGGSYWLGQKDIDMLPDFVTDIRIGRFMLFGYIPYGDRIGRSAISVRAKVLETYPERCHIMTDIGDEVVDTKDCITPNNDDLSFVVSSSNYTIYKTEEVAKYAVGDDIVLELCYRHSADLVKLNNKFEIV